MRAGISDERDCRVLGPPIRHKWRIWGAHQTNVMIDFRVNDQDAGYDDANRDIKRRKYSQDASQPVIGDVESPLRRSSLDAERDVARDGPTQTLVTIVGAAARRCARQRLEPLIKVGYSPLRKTELLDASEPYRHWLSLCRMLSRFGYSRYMV